MASYACFALLLVFSCTLLSVNAILLDSTDEKLEECHDNPNYSCFDFEDKQCIGAYEGFGRKNCPFRCGYCPGNYPKCENEITYCDELGDNVCGNALYGGFLRKNCRKYCNFCTFPGQKIVTTTPEPSTTKMTEPPKSSPVTAVLPTGEAFQDVLSDCQKFHKESCVGVFKGWAIQNCPRTCGYCTNSQPCEDYEECDKLPSTLCTDSNYRILAETACRKFCKICSVPEHSTPVSIPSQMNMSTASSGKTMTSSKEKITQMMSTISGSSASMMPTEQSMTTVAPGSMTGQNSTAMLTKMSETTMMSQNPPMTSVTERVSTATTSKMAEATMTSQTMKSMTTASMSQKSSIASMTERMSTAMMSNMPEATMTSQTMKSMTSAAMSQNATSNMMSSSSSSSLMPSRPSASAKVPESILG